MLYYNQYHHGDGPHGQDQAQQGEGEVGEALIVGVQLRLGADKEQKLNNVIATLKVKRLARYPSAAVPVDVTLIVRGQLGFFHKRWWWRYNVPVCAYRITLVGYNT